MICNEIKIEKNIPPPASFISKLREIKLNEHFSLNIDARNYAYRCAKRIGIKIKTSRLEENTDKCIVWRIE